jgi:hypothetical protein
VWINIKQSIEADNYRESNGGNSRILLDSRNSMFRCHPCLDVLARIGIKIQDRNRERDRDRN